MDTLVKMFTQLGVNESFTTMFGIFVVTYFVMSFLALNKLTNTLVERDHRIAGREKEAAKLKSELSEIEQELNSQLNLSRKEAAVVFQNFKNRATSEQKAILAASRETAAIELKAVRQQIQNQVRMEFEKLQKEIPQIAKLMLEQITSRGSAVKGGKSSEAERTTGA